MLRQFCTTGGALNICLRTTFFLTFGGLLAFGAAAGWAGYHLGVSHGQASIADEAAVHDHRDIAELQHWIGEEREHLDAARREAEDNLDALAIRLAGLQAQLMRIDALGERLVDLAELDAREFDFSQPPASGGPDDAVPGASQSVTDLVAGMDVLERVLHDRLEQLTVLEEWVMNNEVRRQTLPSGLPVVSGWISSDFGRRINPVTGKAQTHEGVDFPGEKGAKVLSVAAGVVTKSERMSGYGNVVEIRHADGLTTRYGHNQENLVKEGERVEKGQVIALLGSSGRSTGPHVHFEVRKDGSPVDPEQYLGDSR